MSDKKSKSSHSRGLFRNYFVYILSFLAIAVVITIIALLIVQKPATSFVHSLEDTFPMAIRDITLDDNTYPSDDEQSTYYYGDKVGNVTIENCGVNTDIYYGANRVSARQGVGLCAIDGSLDEANGAIEIKGYDETYFSGLKYAQVGDIVTITTNSGAYEYRITEVKYIPSDKEAYKQDSDMLVLCSIFSDFSQHSGEYLYVFCERVSEGVN
jgi:LPXTG-site transpeptidase (sortase) family protein